MPSKCSLDNMLKSILSVGNEEQSMFYSPRVYSEQYNAVTSLLISTLVKQYPSNPMVVDMLDPFIRIDVLPVVNGYVDLPDEYRDILGSPYIFLNPEKNGECSCGNVELTPADFKNKMLKGGCQLAPMIIYPESEFIIRTKSSFQYPTWEKPIGFFSGKRQIKVCPVDIGRVGLMYVVNEKKYVYGYTSQPDDTYLFDINTTIESEWGSNAFEPIFKAMLALYSAYSKDMELNNWVQVLNERGIM